MISAVRNEGHAARSLVRSECWTASSESFSFDRSSLGSIHGEVIAVCAMSEEYRNAGLEWDRPVDVEGINFCRHSDFRASIKAEDRQHASAMWERQASTQRATAKLVAVRIRSTLLSFVEVSEFTRFARESVGLKLEGQYLSCGRCNLGGILLVGDFNIDARHQPEAYVAANRSLSPLEDILLAEQISSGKDKSHVSNFPLGQEQQSDDLSVLTCVHSKALRDACKEAEGWRRNK
eukprot:766428-Hanusia_phi.AAC.12